MAKKEKGRTVEQIETEMLKLQKQKRAAHKELQGLAAERRRIILGSQSGAEGGTIVMPEPAILTAKEN
jgi:hypothetical protein